MTKAASALLADALRLSEEARAELAAELLASLDAPPDVDARQAWETEIDRRIAALGRHPEHAAQPSPDSRRRVKVNLSRNVTSIRAPLSSSGSEWQKARGDG